MTLRSRLVVPLVGALLLGVLAAAPTPAQADPGIQPRPVDTSARTVFARSSYLCYGYRSCRQHGMTSAGYARHNRTMYWRMYSGHNCTNYAAYRMVRSGLPNVRPWSGGGNAEYWGTSMRNITDHRPRVGAVAWWRAYAGPAGSAGHVAYVERVVSSDEIVVSQDSWGGDFSWAVITKASGNWPSGFVHFNDRTLLNRGAPVITGTTRVGSVLTSTAGRWRPTDATVSYQWYAGGTVIPGATGSSLELTSDQVGRRITVRATARKLGFPARSATSEPTAAVQPDVLRNTRPPAVSGTPQVDATLRVDPGAWTPRPRLSYQWLANGHPVAGATGTTLAVTPALVDRTISARVTASRNGYRKVVRRTARTLPVRRGAFHVSTAPHVSGTPRPGEVLTATEGTFQPSAESVAVQWLRGGRPVAGATGPTYRVTRSDLGERISARVTLARAGYTTTSTYSGRTGRARALPRVRVKVERGPAHHLRVTVHVRARGVEQVTGTVAARVARVVRTGTLRQGESTLNLWRLPDGTRTLTIRYRRSDSVSRGVVRRTVQIG